MLRVRSLGLRRVTEQVAYGSRRGGAGLVDPDEVAAAYDQFRSGFRPRPPTPEEDAALGLAIELSEAEARAFIEENRGTTMASEFPDDLRETVLRDLAEVMAQAGVLQRSWEEDSDPADCWPVRGPCGMPLVCSPLGGDAVAQSAPS